MALKRLRGVLLRIARSRRAALLVGAGLLVPASILWLRDFSWESSVTDGLALVAGATGLAFVVAGLQGRVPDWRE
jgi:hypothetical protein